MNKERGFSSGLVSKILGQLWSIRDWFEDQHQFLFQDSTIIIVYDAEELMERKEDLTVHARMFDLSNVTSSDGRRDENYIQCLDELIQTIDNLETLSYHRQGRRQDFRAPGENRPGPPPPLEFQEVRARRKIPPVPLALYRPDHTKNEQTPPQHQKKSQ